MKISGQPEIKFAFLFDNIQALNRLDEAHPEDNLLIRILISSGNILTGTYKNVLPVIPYTVKLT